MRSVSKLVFGYDHSHSTHHRTYPKGKLTYRQRKSLPSKVFVFPKSRKYPIENETHARNALARVSRFGTEKEKREVCKAVEKKYPEIHAESCNMHNA